MQQFRKKPVVIEAVQITYANFSELLALQETEGDRVKVYCHTIDGTDTVTNSIAWVEINTLEGTMRGNYGDWIIRGVAGELYPCKPDIFEKTYEPAGDSRTLRVNINVDRAVIQEHIDDILQARTMEVCGCPKCRIGG